MRCANVYQAPACAEAFGRGVCRCFMISPFIFPFKRDKNRRSQAIGKNRFEVGAFCLYLYVDLHAQKQETESPVGYVYQQRAGSKTRYVYRILPCRFRRVDIFRKEGFVRIVDLSEISISDSNAVAEIAAKAGVNLRDCYQCGKCSAGCPMTQGMDVPPRKIIRYLQLDLLDEALQAKAPWVCAGCEVCSARCPQSVDIASLMREVRKASKAAGYKPVPESDTFEELFISNVRQFGKSNEAILAMRYNLASRHFLQDVSNAPRMLARGMLGMKIHTIEDKEAIREIVDKTRKGAERS